jgi:hypothetical protein
MSLSESDEHADTRSMEIEVNVTTLCYKCDRDAIAFGDGQRPLCPRHATIFVTAPRILDLERSLEQDEPEALSHSESNENQRRNDQKPWLSSLRESSPDWALSTD